MDDAKLLFAGVTLVVLDIQNFTYNVYNFIYDAWFNFM